MKWNKNPYRAVIWFFVPLLCACDSSENDGRKGGTTKQMVHEGMPAGSLRNVLGEPDSTVKGGTVYDVEMGVKKSVERWHYPKRTVVLIDDTVKVPNERPAVN